jgi:hypothetical protein
MYLYLTCNVKLGIQNTKFKVINQHINDVLWFALGKWLLPWCPWFFLPCFHPRNEFFLKWWLYILCINWDFDKQLISNGRWQEMWNVSFFRIPFQKTFNQLIQKKT